jgi:hypothetical protein
LDMIVNVISTKRIILVLVHVLKMMAKFVQHQHQFVMYQLKIDIHLRMVLLLYHHYHQYHHLIHGMQNFVYNFLNHMNKLFVIQQVILLQAVINMDVLFQ